MVDVCHSNQMKACKKCLIKKPLSEFYRHKKAADGTLGSCKECVKRAVRVNRKRNIEYYREYDRKRGNRQSKEYSRIYYRMNKDKVLEKQRQVRAGKHREKYLARNAVTRALRSGKLTRPNECEGCGIECTPGGHHEDYSKKLDVVWLCPKCHGFVHKVREDMRK